LFSMKLEINLYQYNRKLCKGNLWFFILKVTDAVKQRT
jgi:hypothetical protein